MQQVVIAIAESERAIEQFQGVIIGVWISEATAERDMSENLPDLVNGEDFTFYIKDVL